jgi:hypothetical protein
MRRRRSTPPVRASSPPPSLSFADQASLVVHPSSLFASEEGGVAGTPEYDRDGGATLSRHQRAGTSRKARPAETLRDALKRRFYRAKYLLTRGEQTDAVAARAAIDPAALAAKAPGRGGNIAVLVPVRDAAEHIAPFLAAMARLDHPADRIKLVFCEGDSRDGSFDLLRRATEPLRDRYRDIVLLQKPLGTVLDRTRRTWPKLQRERRCGLAKVRNHLIRHGLDDGDDWALWIDIDVWKFPDDIVQILTATGHRIVTPNCVRRSGGASFDMNSFVTTRPERDHRYYRSVVGGLYQPPADFAGRLHLSDVRHLEQVEARRRRRHDAAGRRGAASRRAGVSREALPRPGRDRGIRRSSPGTPASRRSGCRSVEIFHVPW